MKMLNHSNFNYFGENTDLIIGVKKVSNLYKLIEKDVIHFTEKLSNALETAVNGKIGFVYYPLENEEIELYYEVINADDDNVFITVS